MQYYEEEIQVEDFIPEKEYPVGGYFRIGKEVFKVVKDGYGVQKLLCPNCDVGDGISNCNEVPCSSYERGDNNGVHFILYDTEE